LHQGTHKALRHGSHSFTCKQYHACLCIVNVHQMSPPQQLRQRTSNCSLLLIYRPRKDERLSWPGWLTYSGWFTDISGHPSATGRAQDSESTPAKDRRYTAGPRNLMSELFCHMLACELSRRMRDVLQGASSPDLCSVYVDLRALRNDRVTLVEKGSPQSLCLMESGKVQSR